MFDRRKALLVKRHQLLLLRLPTERRKACELERRRRAFQPQNGVTDVIGVQFTAFAHAVLRKQSANIRKIGRKNRNTGEAVLEQFVRQTVVVAERNILHQAQPEVRGLGNGHHLRMGHGVVHVDVGVLYGQTLDLPAFAGIGLILAGVLVLALFSSSMPH